MLIPCVHNGKVSSLIGKRQVLSQQKIIQLDCRADRAKPPDSHAALIRTLRWSGSHL